MSAIEVSSLEKSYGQLKAVDGISFSVRKGEVFSLLGPNGAGKTTTIEILEGLRRPDQRVGSGPVEEGIPTSQETRDHTSRIHVLPKGNPARGGNVLLDSLWSEE